MPRRSSSEMRMSGKKGKGMLERVDQIDFNELYVLLLDATRKAFTAVKEAHPSETFYAFVLHYDHNHDGYIILPSCNSEEAHMRRWELTETDRVHQTLEWSYSRWSCDDWRYYRWGRQYFNSVSQWISLNIYRTLGRADNTEIAAVMTSLEEGVTTTCLNVMKALDQEKFFGQGEARERVVLNIVSENQSEIENISHVYLLNPPSVYERWTIEMELYLQAHSFFNW